MPNPTPTTPSTELSTLAGECATLLIKHRKLIEEMQALIMAQKISREQAMQINPLQWCSEVIHDWAIKQLE